MFFFLNPSLMQIVHFKYVFKPCKAYLATDGAEVVTPPIETLVHDLQAVDLGTLVGCHCVQPQEPAEGEGDAVGKGDIGDCGAGNAHLESHTREQAPQNTTKQ